MDASSVKHKIWNYLGERGVYSQDPDTLFQCFQIALYEDNYFCYKLKPFTKIEKIKCKDNKGFFGGIVLHDPMCGLIPNEENPDNVYLIRIDEEDDVVEAIKSIKYNEFQNLINKDITLEKIFNIKNHTSSIIKLI